MSQPLNTDNPWTEPPASDDPPLDILLVEDVLSDALLTRIALDGAHIPYKLSTLRNGSQLLPYLERYRRHYPDLILLDLGLPGMSGFDVLNVLATNPPAIRSIPIVILTGLTYGEYFLGDSYPLCILDYIEKPCSANKMGDILARARKRKTDAVAEFC